jgi:hypothetical protein
MLYITSGVTLVHSVQERYKWHRILNVGLKMDRNIQE